MVSHLSKFFEYEYGYNQSLLKHVEFLFFFKKKSLAHTVEMYIAAI